MKLKTIYLTTALNLIGLTFFAYAESIQTTPMSIQVLVERSGSAKILTKKLNILTSVLVKNDGLERRPWNVTKCKEVLTTIKISGPFGSSQVEKNVTFTESSYPCNPSISLDLSDAELSGLISNSTAIKTACKGKAGSGQSHPLNIEIKTGKATFYSDSTLDSVKKTKVGWTNRYSSNTLANYPGKAMISINCN